MKSSILLFLVMMGTWATYSVRAEEKRRLLSPWVMGRDLFAVDPDRDQIVGQKPDGKWAVVFHRKGCDPAGLAALGGGELALACKKEKAILLVQMDGKIQRLVRDDADGEDLLPPQRVAFASDGSVFFTASRPLRTEGIPRGGLYWIPAGQQNAWAISSSPGFPQGLLIERDMKHVIVAERMSGRVVRYELHGSRGFHRRLRKPKVLFDFKKSIGLAGDIYSPGPSGLDWASETSFWVSFVGDSKVRQLQVETGQVLQEIAVEGGPLRISHLSVDRIRKVLWISSEKGLTSVAIPPTPASP